MAFISDTTVTGKARYGLRAVARYKKCAFWAAFLTSLPCSAGVPGLGNRPLIEANFGQFPKDIQYVARLGSMSAGITADGIEFLRGRDEFSVRFIGAASIRCAPVSPVESEANYLALNPAVTHVPEYSAVLCTNFYKGIDWRIHMSEGQLEHDWEIAPGANLSALAMVLDGDASAHVRPDGALEIRSGGTSIIWKRPIAWQYDGKERIAVPVKYRLQGRRIELGVGTHRINLPLVIDPAVDYSYVIGSGLGDFGCQVAVDASGNIYFSGLTVPSGFQITQGAAVQVPVQNGDLQIFVRKLAPDGTTVLYSTFLGAATNSNHPIGMRIDNSGSVFLAADIFNSPLPISGTPIDPNGSIGVFKLSPTGSQLLYATRVIPAGYDESVALAIDSAGFAYVASGGVTPVVSKIDPRGQTQIFLYQPYTGNYNGSVADMAIGSDGSIYLAGTNCYLSGGGMVTTPGALKTTSTSGSYYGYLMRIKPDGSGPIYATYIGTDVSDVEGLSALAIDSSGAAYVAGYVHSLPLVIDGVSVAQFALHAKVLGAYSAQPHDSTGFVMKVNPEGSTAIFTDLVPGSLVAAITVDGGRNVYAAGPFNAGGGTYNRGLPNMTGVNVIKIDPTGQDLLYYSAIPMGYAVPAGANQPIVGMTLDLNGAAYIVGGSATAQVPQAQDIPALGSGAYLLKMDAAPVQCDLAVSVTSAPSGFTPTEVFQPGQVPITFTITNNGAAAANDVVFSVSKDALLGGQVETCTSSGSGNCTDDSLVPADPRVSFSSIAPGASETVTLAINPYISPLSSIEITPLVSTSTSDVNQSNNSVTAVVPVAWVPVTAHSFLAGGGQTDLMLRYGVVGTTAPPTIAGGVEVYPTMAKPGTQVQIGWESPQVTNSGDVVVFQQWADGSTSNPRSFTASRPALTENAVFQRYFTPFISANGVVNAASYAANGVSPGEIVSLFGLNLGSQAIGQVVNGAFTTTLGGLSVSFDGVPAPIVYTGGTQANLIVPYEVAGKSSTTMTVAVAGSSASVHLSVVAAAPALFTSAPAEVSAYAVAAALNQDGTVNSISNPAHPGDVITLYGTGEGLIQPAPANGTISSSPAPTPVLPINVSIAGSITNPLYAAEAPGLTAGVIQINARIPNNVIYNGNQWPVSFFVGANLSPQNYNAGYQSQTVSIFVK